MDDDIDCTEKLSDKDIVEMFNNHSSSDEEEENGSNEDDIPAPTSKDAFAALKTLERYNLCFEGSLGISDALVQCHNGLVKCQKKKQAHITDFL